MTSAGSTSTARSGPGPAASSPRPASGDEEARSGRLVEAEDTQGAEAFAGELLGRIQRWLTWRHRGSTSSSPPTRGPHRRSRLRGVPDPRRTPRRSPASSIRRRARHPCHDPAAAEALDQLSDDRLVEATCPPRERGRARPIGASPIRTFAIRRRPPESASGWRRRRSARVEIAAISIRSGRDPRASSPLCPVRAELPADVGSDALAYLGLGEPGTSVDELPRAGVGGRPPNPQDIPGRRARPARAGGRQPPRGLLPLLARRLRSRSSRSGAEVAAPAPGTLAPSGVPYARPDRRRHRRGVGRTLVANLQRRWSGRSARPRAPGIGVRTARIAGVDARTCRSTRHQTDLAVYEGGW